MTLLWCGGQRLHSSPFCNVSKQLGLYPRSGRWCNSKNPFKLKCTTNFDKSSISGLQVHHVRFFSRAAKKSYYEVLHITPKATQAQVKNAYYDLSKKYHPDQYKGKEDAAIKFREIAEAYEVLGNLQKRRMYDKGILNLGVAATPQEAEEYSSKFYESRSKRAKMPSSGRTPIYNFDEWSKLHYESNFARRKSAKERYEEMKETQHIVNEEKKSRSVVIIVFMIALAFLYNTTLSSEFDVPRKSTGNSK